MNRKLFFLVAVVFLFVVGIQLTSCENKDLIEVRVEKSESVNVLKPFAEFHNAGLDYIKSSILENSGLLTKDQLDSVLCDWINKHYGEHKEIEILAQINPLKERFFHGQIPLLSQTRSGEIEEFPIESNSIALDAINTCMAKISVQMDTEKEIFDNRELLDEMQATIVDTYRLYKNRCESQADIESLDKAIGVLYGSIEYWTNSSNVESWSKIVLIDVQNTENVNAPKYSRSDNNEGEKKEEKKKLSKAEWIKTVAAADAIGAIVGAGVASSPAALAASAAAGIYFDVE